MAVKVVHLVRQYHPSIGGMEDVVKNIARHQRLFRNQSARIVTLDRLFRNSQVRLAPTTVVDGIDVTRLPFFGSDRYPICPQVLAQVTDADVIHVHGIDFFFDYLAATKSIHRKKLVASTHGGFFHTNFMRSFKKAYFNTVTRLSAHAYDRIVASSDNDGRIFSELVTPPKLMVIENGVDVEKYRGNAAEERRPSMIYFGRWSRNKALDAVLSLFAQLVRLHPQWTLVLAGREYDHGAEELLAWADMLGVGDAVRIAPNPSDGELADLIRQASYFICLSKHEGFGLAPIEAMSAGLIPILSDIPPFRHLVEQSGLGFLLDADHPDRLIADLVNFHRDKSVEHGRQRQRALAFSERYDWRHVADGYVRIYEELAERHDE